jgi:hypothetical protein
MIGQTISHYPDKSRRDAEKRRKIPEKLGAGGMFENCPRTLCVSGSNFQNPAVFWREALP